MNAAKQALENSKGLFPQLDHQKRVIARSMRKQKGIPNDSGNEFEGGNFNDFENLSSDDEDSRLPMQYRRRASSDSSEQKDDDRSRKRSRSASTKPSPSTTTTRPTKSSKKKRKRKRRTNSCTSQTPSSVCQSEKLTPKLVEDYFSALSDDDTCNIESLDNDQENTKNMFETSVEPFKIEGTECLSSDVESGEII